MQTLPKWILTGTMPSVHDFESATAIEQTAKLYAAVNGVINAFNTLSDELNGDMEKFTTANGAELEEIRKSVEKRLRCKFEELDALIMELKAGANNAIAVFAKVSAADNGKVLGVINGKIVPATLTSVYDPETEHLSIGIGG